MPSEQECKRFDARAHRWETLSPTGRGDHPALVIDDKIYTFGGRIHGFISTVENYDMKKNKWIIQGFANIEHPFGGAAPIRYQSK